MFRILVIEDEDDIQKILENYLVDQGYAVTLANDGVDGIAKFHTNPQFRSYRGRLSVWSCAILGGAAECRTRSFAAGGAGGRGFEGIVGP